jgi:hypothetical protein
MSRFTFSSLALCALAMASCSKPPAPQPSQTAASPANTPAVPQPPVPKPAVSEPAPLPVISLGGAKSSAATPASAPGSVDISEARQAAIAALQPLQSLLGKWRGITRKEVSGDMKAIDEPEWVWDLRTDKARPALVMSTPKGTYYRQFRLSGAGETDRFRLVATDVDGHERTLEGTLAEPVEQFQEGGTTVQHKFKLLFEEPGEGKDRWQVAIAQQNNDRYLVELSRVRPTGVQRIDTIGHQREGTSVAKSDTDYGERKCIISGGLGTTSVTYKGKTYWVCCSGCLAAFNEDPESWLRDAAKKAAP